MNEIDNGLQCLSLAIAVMCPESIVLGFRAIEHENTEEEFQSPRGLKEGMSLKIKDNVTFRALWKNRKTPPVLDLQHLTLKPSRALTLEL